MTKEQRQQSLINARRAWWKLSEYIVNAMYKNDPTRIDIQCLLNEFKRLDDKEQAQIKAGKKSGRLGAEYGKLGGRPKKKRTRKKAGELNGGTK